jgi:hypothetical protein
MLLLFLFLLLPVVGRGQAALEPWHLHQSPAEAEHWVYRLAYRGILTAFAWKELADVAFTARVAPARVQGEAACELEMRLSTEAHRFAEFLRPTRYRWRSFSDPMLQRVLLVEMAELTDDDREHRITWVDWSRRSIELFRLLKRRKVPEFLGDWQQEGRDHGLLRALLRDEPEYRPGERLMSWDKALSLDSVTEHLLDPLGFVHAARWHSWKEGDLVRPITFKDEIRHYRAHLVGREPVIVGGVPRSALKVEMRRRNTGEAKEEGFMRVWFSDNERRTPLKFVIDGFIGRIRLRLLPGYDGERRQPWPCVAPPRQRAAASLHQGWTQVDRSLVGKSDAER